MILYTRSSFLTAKALPRRDVWCTVGKVKKLDDLNKHTPDQLQVMAIKIVDEFASMYVPCIQSQEPESERDDMLTQAIQWNKDILDTWLLTMQFP
jgi:hypothetical protein